jgi:hypothetical protein
LDNGRLIVPEALRRVLSSYSRGALMPRAPGPKNG